jgi:hypothetical protein
MAFLRVTIAVAILLLASTVLGVPGVLAVLVAEPTVDHDGDQGGQGHCNREGDPRRGGALLLGELIHRRLPAL